MRARDIGIRIGRGVPGPKNAITDVPGVRVGHATLISGDGPLVVGNGPVRTGVTLIVPREDIWQAPVFAGSHRLNGNGQLTGLEWVRESGLLTTPIALTNTCSVGVVHDSLIAAQLGSQTVSALSVVGETWDGTLNDILGMHVRPEHVHRALDVASPYEVAEGNVGAGTGTICHGFKGGIGTSSRIVGDFTVGVLVQANQGERALLRINGLPVGEAIGPEDVPIPTQEPTRAGSIVGVVGTDAPLLPHQCSRLAQRVGLGVARVGGVGEDWSGDLLIAFSTGNGDADLSSEEESAAVVSLRMLPGSRITPLFEAVVDSTEEAILNALLAAGTMTGRDGITAHALGPDRLLASMRRLGRL